MHVFVYIYDRGGNPTRTWLKDLAARTNDYERQIAVARIKWHLKEKTTLHWGGCRYFIKNDNALGGLYDQTGGNPQSIFSIWLGLSVCIPDIKSKDGNCRVFSLIRWSFLIIFFFHWSLNITKGCWDLYFIFVCFMDFMAWDIVLLNNNLYFG